MEEKSFPDRYREREGGSFALGRGEGDLATVFVLNDVTCDTHAKTCTLTDGLSGEEILKEPLLHIVAHALTVVGYADRQLIGRSGNADTDLWRVTSLCRLALIPHSRTARLRSCGITIIGCIPS